MEISSDLCEQQTSCPLWLLASSSLRLLADLSPPSTSERDRCRRSRRENWCSPPNLYRTPYYHRRWCCDFFGGLAILFGSISPGTQAASTYEILYLRFRFCWHFHRLALSTCLSTCLSTFAFCSSLDLSATFASFRLQRAYSSTSSTVSFCFE